MTPEFIQTNDIGQMTWPQLYGMTSTGGTKVWQIIVQSDKTNNSVAIKAYHGKLGGKMTEQIKLVKKGKNIGKKNETTPWEQACSEAASTYQEKLDKNYGLEIPGEDEAPTNLLPQKAHNFRKRSHDIVYPAYVQPKFNGIRCLATRCNDSHIEFTSKKGKSFNFICQHLVPDLLKVMKIGEIFDGELYHHGWTFQKIARTVKKIRSWGHELQYHVFDLADDKKTFGKRSGWIQAGIDKLGSGLIHNVETILIQNKETVKFFHDQYVRNGYEGVIVRNANGGYSFGHQNKDLQKYKEFIDEEFPIVGFKGYAIEDVEAIVFICGLKNGKTFDCVMKGSIESRIEMFTKGASYIGKEITVRYQELSEDGIPIFPVGLIIRDYEG